MLLWTYSYIYWPTFWGLVLVLGYLECMNLFQMIRFPHYDHKIVFINCLENTSMVSSGMIGFVKLLYLWILLCTLSLVIIGAIIIHSREHLDMSMSMYLLILSRNLWWVLRHNALLFKDNGNICKFFWFLSYGSIWGYFLH